MKKTAKWEKQVANLAAHEAVIEKRLEEKDEEVKSANIQEIKDIHGKARADLLNTLINTVRERTKLELNLLTYYENVDEEIFIESDEESDEESEEETEDS